MVGDNRFLLLRGIDITIGGTMAAGRSLDLRPRYEARNELRARRFICIGRDHAPPFLN